MFFISGCIVAQKIFPKCNLQNWQVMLNFCKKSIQKKLLYGANSYSSFFRNFSLTVEIHVVVTCFWVKLVRRHPRLRRLLRFPKFFARSSLRWILTAAPTNPPSPCHWQRSDVLPKTGTCFGSYLLSHKSSRLQIKHRSTLRALRCFGRGDRIRTCDILLPNSW